MTNSTLRSALALSALLLLPLACTEGGASKTSASASAPTPMPSALAGVHALKCGCAIDSIGKCGNYIEVEGRFVALKAPIAMGPMEFCKKDGLKARADGQLVDGTFVATSFAYEK